MRTLLSFTAILFPAFLYLSFRLVHAWYDLCLLALTFLLLLTFPFKKVHKAQLHLIYFSMGVLSYLTIYTLLRDLVGLVSGWYAPKGSVWLLSALSLCYGLWNALRGPRLKKITLPYPDLPEELDGFKIAQISDLHVGPTIGRKYVEKTVDLINSLAPDMIAMTGDIGDGPVKAFRDDIGPLARLRPKLGTFYVPGNHEYYWGINEWLGVMNNLGAVVLVNRGKIIYHNGKQILVGGIPDPVATLIPDPATVLEAATESDMKILLAHRPGFSKVAAELGYDLQLSGHTHGGQFFPWTVAVRFFHEVTQGLMKTGKMWLYVSPGTGSWGPLLRLGTTPEVSLLTLKKLAKGNFDRKVHVVESSHGFL